MNCDFPSEQFKQTQSFVNQYLMLVSFLHCYYYSLTASCKCVISFRTPPTPPPHIPLPSTQAILQDLVFGRGEEKWLSVEGDTLHYTFIHQVLFPALQAACRGLVAFTLVLFLFLYVLVVLILKLLLCLNMLKLLQLKFRSYRIEFQSSFYFVSLFRRPFTLFLYR